MIRGRVRVDRISRRITTPSGWAYQEVAMEATNTDKAHDKLESTPGYRDPQGASTEKLSELVTEYGQLEKQAFAARQNVLRHLAIDENEMGTDRTKSRADIAFEALEVIKHWNDDTDAYMSACRVLAVLRDTIK